ncbi:MAG: hypothetical protein EHM20_15175, partial [Alphaproteobacteria bacterium]
MGKNKGIKVTSLFIGVLLCMVSMQIAFAQPEANITTENVTIENNTIEHKIDPQSYFTGVYAGSGTQFTVSFTNQGSETLTIEPKLVPNPQSEKNMDESWITASPANANVAPGSSQKFVIEVNVPRDTKGGNYQSIITFTDDLVPNFNGYFNSMNLEISVQALPKIQLETQYISDTIDACKEYEYKVNMKNVADKDVTINPKLLKYNPYYDPSYIPAFDSDAIEISAPSIVKAGETANMTIKVKVPENATGRYYGTISMNVEGEEEANIYGSNSQINIEF